MRLTIVRKLKHQKGIIFLAHRVEESMSKLRMEGVYDVSLDVDIRLFFFQIQIAYTETIYNGQCQPWMLAFQRTLCASRMRHCLYLRGYVIPRLYICR